MRKKLVTLMLASTLVVSVVGGCSTEKKGVSDTTSTPSVTASPEASVKEYTQPETAEQAKELLINGNNDYVSSGKNTGDISKEKRQDTTTNGQHPYATVITCSDSRVPAEHIFNAGIGEIFTIRTAGNVIGDYELGSVEYGAEHLGTPIVVVLGHTNCGAVGATLEGGAHGNIAKITDEIASCLPEDVTSTEAEVLNVENSIKRIMASEEMAHLVEEGKVKVVGAIYDIETGEVNFLE